MHERSSDGLILFPKHTQCSSDEATSVYVYIFVQNGVLKTRSNRNEILKQA